MSTTTLSKRTLEALLTARFKLDRKSSIKGLDEDAAVLAYGPMYTLVAAAQLVEGTDFDLVYCPLQHVGYKAVVASLADLIAMNGRGEQLVVRVSASSKFTYEALEALYSGIEAACQQYTLDLIGNEIKTAATGLTISTTITGSIDPAKVCYRSKAKPYDLVCVTGNLGAAYLGLQILIREKKVFEADPAMQPQLAPYQYLIGRQLKPNARVDVIQSLDELGVVPTSMIHVKEGLAAAVLHICEQSEVGMAIYENKLPIDRQTYEVAEIFQLGSIVCAMHGGEDYELLFTIPQASWSLLENNSLVHAVGYVTEADQGIHIITSGETKVAITAPGWE
jgi:thiamine-monophosphate kinase